MSNATQCPWCGADVVQPATGRPRVFCQTAHRVAMHRWTKAWNAIQVGLDGIGRCYCCARRGKVVSGDALVAGDPPFCEGCAPTCNPDAGIMRPADEDAREYWNRRSPCITDWGWHRPPAGIGWNEAKPRDRRLVT